MRYLKQSHFLRRPSRSMYLTGYASVAIGRGDAPEGAEENSRRGRKARGLTLSLRPLTDKTTHKSCAGVDGAPISTVSYLQEGTAIELSVDTGHISALHRTGCSLAYLPISHLTLRRHPHTFSDEFYNFQV
ncbi:hypothetical protein J6590_071179 [Homalodisca vitripennis]|nr:hypothetical protein J6590_071179 [Homalodisca vitripennis]